MAEVEQLYKRAEESFAKHSYDYARDLLMQILLLDPNHAQARKALRATILTKFKELGAPGKLKLMALKGKVKTELAVARNNLNRKIEICQKYLIQDPSNSDVRGILAESLYALGQILGAATEAEMAVESDPKNVPAYKVLASARSKLGDIRGAQEALTRGQQHAPEDRDMERLQRNLAAEATTAKGFVEAADAKGGYRAVIKDREQADVLERRQHLIKSSDDANVFIEDLEKEFKAKPDYKTARRIGDTFLEFLKDPDSAAMWYRKAVELSPHDSVLKDRVENSQIRKFDMQIAEAEQKDDPSVKDLKVGRLKFMIQAYERRAKDRPTDMEVQFGLGRSYYAAGKSFLDKAIGAFQQAVRDPKRKCDSHYYLGLAFQKKGHFDMADQQFEHALNSGVLGEDKRLSLIYQRATTQADGGNFAKAIELGKEIMQTNIGYRDISQLVEDWTAKAK
ncbi:MAG: tetratricopeptide repeat protein [Planctomycetota bacterium]|jgi:tetratricopeptide (TPR) repeat protein